MKKKIVSTVEALKPELLRIHSSIHDNPEVGLEEYKSSALLADFLEGQGFRVRRGIADLPTAFRADSGPDKKRPRAGLLAEYDALPGLGHACGHSIIGTAACGAAAALRKVKPELPITVLGTPAEELGIGKIRLIEAGEFESLDAAMMVHPSSKRQIHKNYLGVKRLVFTFKGKASHAAAYPEDGVNALDGVIQLFNNINALRQQLKDDVRVHGIISEGGLAPNIIPELGQAKFFVRAIDLDTLEDAAERVIACAKGAAKATGCRLKIQVIEPTTLPLKFSISLTQIYRDQLDYLGLEEYIAPPDKHMGSTDIGNVSQVVPTIHPHVSLAKPGTVSIHTPEFEKAAGGPGGKRALIEGAKCLALSAYDLLSHKGLFDQVKKEFDSKPAQ